MGIGRQISLDIARRGAVVVRVARGAEALGELPPYCSVSRPGRRSRRSRARLPLAPRRVEREVDLYMAPASPSPIVALLSTRRKGSGLLN